MHGDERHTDEGFTDIALGRDERAFVLEPYNSIAPAEATDCSVLLIVVRYRECWSQWSTAMLSCLHGSRSRRSSRKAPLRHQSTVNIRSHGEK
jgi:hypothetical protein